ncbi:hypothetical protein L1077_26965, partial [Pseudoalteromonas luteoviolacea]|uniref:hypothetical protein n=1 Tax=Pseudoalteromonas luteoviolacea TaxID=43657 RepID=UPI001F38FE16
SSGKSTFVNSMIYGIGMEELIGPKGPASLPYALKDKFEFEGLEKKVVSSAVYLQVTNSKNETITLRRGIKEERANSKLVQVIHGAFLDDMSQSYRSQPTFLHDKGAAQDPNTGFYAFFEKFIDFNMPEITDSKGKETKLYLQSVFAGLMIEQKRGWTDYIANIPYYGVSGMREKVMSFLLDLDVFRNVKEINRLHELRNEYIYKWQESTTKIRLAIESKALSIRGVPRNPVIDFKPGLVLVEQKENNELKILSEVRVGIINKLDNYNQKIKHKSNENKSEDIINEVGKLEMEVDDLLVLQSSGIKKLKISKSQLEQYSKNLVEIEKDLKTNKMTKKLVDFGAQEADIKFAQGLCSTCMQPVDDILSSPDSISMPMSLEENITHLNNQYKMIKSLILGLQKEIEIDEGQLNSVKKELLSKRRLLISMRQDVKSSSKVLESEVRIKINLEDRLKDLDEIESLIRREVKSLEKISADYKVVNASLNRLNQTQLSFEDSRKLDYFSSQFRLLAKSFGYRSANVEEVQIKYTTLLPYLEDKELRETVRTPSETTDIKADSSASDFVRLIWSYILSTYFTSKKFNGNHPGFILFDEPAQHSMSTKGLNNLLLKLESSSTLQSIVAASFDESDDNYDESTNGLHKFTLKRFPRKLISTFNSQL